MLGEPIPKKMREEMDAMPYYHQCARNEALNDHVCFPDPVRGRLIEWEHAMIHGSRKVNEIWAIVPICWWAHRGPGLVKEINQWLALNRASDEDLDKYERHDWRQRRQYLNGKYGIPTLSTGKAPF